MRLIYGNDITVKALKENKITPWPNGAIIVKVVWNSQHEDEHGNVKPGNFNNVQMMIRDEKRFKATEGWGFARFNGLSLVQYGNTIIWENGFTFWPFMLIIGIFRVGKMYLPILISPKGNINRPAG